MAQDKEKLVVSLIVKKGWNVIWWWRVSLVSADAVVVAVRSAESSSGALSLSVVLKAATAHDRCLWCWKNSSHCRCLWCWNNGLQLWQLNEGALCLTACLQRLKFRSGTHGCLVNITSAVLTLLLEHLEWCFLFEFIIFYEIAHCWQAKELQIFFKYAFLSFLFYFLQWCCWILKRLRQSWAGPLFLPME